MIKNGEFNQRSGNFNKRNEITRITLYEQGK